MNKKRFTNKNKFFILNITFISEIKTNVFCEKFFLPTKMN